MTRPRFVPAPARIASSLVSAILGLGGGLAGVAAQVPSSAGESEAAVGGSRIFAESCARCHGGAGTARAAGRSLLASMSPRAIVSVLEDGVMSSEGADLTRGERVAVAEHLSRRPYSKALLPESAFCADRGRSPLDPAAVSWMGFGGDLAGTGFQSTERAGLRVADVSALELRWAFAFPDASETRTKPTVVEDVILVGGPFGEVLALEAATGCVRWTFEADAGIRGAILVDEDEHGRTLAYFVDFRTNVYALDVAAGELAWKTHAGRHSAANNTGSPALLEGRLFVPLSTMEVLSAGDPEYECCTASGAVVALDAQTGAELWYHRVIRSPPEESGRNAAGTRLFAPSGAPVWSSPTIDAGRGLVYVGTGENYTHPTTVSSDAILALDIQTGERAWSFQATEADAFNIACTTARNRENCPTPIGPDLDFGMAPILVTREDGTDLLVAGQKSGVVWGLDPDDGGAVLWSTRVGKGGALGGIHWGMATDGRLAYATNADRADAVIVNVNPERAPTPGLYAIDLMTGDVAWSQPAPTDTCGDRRGCFAANSAAPSVIPGVVFAGGLDGHIRAYASEDGRILWDVDTAREFETVNGVPGRGGAIDGPGPVIAGGMVFVNSGYVGFGQMPGNLLLAFGKPKD